jgi:hypothetical protein
MGHKILAATVLVLGAGLFRPTAAAPFQGEPSCPMANQKIEQGQVVKVLPSGDKYGMLVFGARLHQRAGRTHFPIAM